MDLERLQELNSLGESENLEFKKSTGQLNRAGETLCGFLNVNGGRVLIGVTSSGQPAGQEVSDSTLRHVAQMRSKFEPPAPIGMERVPVGGKNEAIVLKAIPSEASLPFAFEGRPYVRVGPTTRLMSQEEYQTLLLRKVHSTHRWENTISTAVTVGELDQEEVLRTVRLGKETGRIPESTGTNAEDLLSRLGLMYEGRLLNAAVVLFGTSFLPHYPQCHLRLARFRGKDKSEFLDQRQLEGHGFLLLEEAMTFLRRHLPVAGRIQAGIFERQDEPLFPPLALREALVNAFCHRDYSIPGGAVSLAVYDNRLEIWSDGTLPFGLQVEDLKQEHPSKPRNPIIARIFYLRGLVERWGRGTQKIVELCVRAGHPEPEFLEQSGAVGVRFLPAGYVPPLRIDHDLTDRQREILQILAGQEAIPLREIISRMTNPPSSETVRDDLASLKMLKLIGPKGHGRGATWSLIRNKGNKGGK